MCWLNKSWDGQEQSALLVSPQIIFQILNLWNLSLGYCRPLPPFCAGVILIPLSSDLSFLWPIWKSCWEIKNRLSSLFCCSVYLFWLTCVITTRADLHLLQFGQFHSTKVQYSKKWYKLKINATGALKILVKIWRTVLNISLYMPEYQGKDQ